MKPEREGLALLLIAHADLAIAVSRWPPVTLGYVEAFVATSIDDLVEQIPYVGYYFVTIDDESERVMRDATTKHNAQFEREEVES